MIWRSKNIHETSPNQEKTDRDLGEFESGRVFFFLFFGDNCSSLSSVATGGVPAKPAKGCSAVVEPLVEEKGEMRNCKSSIFVNRAFLVVSSCLVLCFLFL